MLDSHGEMQEAKETINPNEVMSAVEGRDLQARMIRFHFKLRYNPRLPSGGYLELRALPNPRPNRFIPSGGL